jgi:hypothetical protein
VDKYFASFKRLASKLNGDIALNISTQICTELAY